MSDVTEPRAEDSRQKHREGQAAIRRLQRPIRPTILIAQGLTLLSAALGVAPYVALVALGNLLLDAHQQGVPVDRDRVDSIVRWLLSAFLTKLTLFFIALLVTHFADLRLRSLHREQVLTRLAQAPLAWFSQATSGRVRKAIQDDTTTVHTVIAHGPVEKLNAIASPLLLWGYAMVIDWRLGLLAIATIPLYVLTYSLSMRGMAEKTAEMDNRLGDVSATMVELASGIAVVKAFGQTGKAHHRYRAAASDFNRFYRAWCLPLVTVSCLSMLWIAVPVVLLVNLGGGALMVDAGWVTVPEVLATTLIALVLPEAIIAVASLTWSYQLAGGAATRLCEMLDTPVLPPAENPREPEGHTIELHDVSYGYGEPGSPERVQALTNVNLTFPEGTVTALVGPSGSGKSTLGMLLARFADPDQGSITLGGVDLRELSEETLYRHVSFVLQDTQLLSTSVRANIALARPEASLDEVRAAARTAQIDDVIMSLPHGYDTVLGTDTHLSGGQQQRIAIARAVLQDTPVLVLDEATAMADPESEADIQRALNALVHGRTVIVIAHRPASIRGADQIVVMDQGQVRARGTDDQVREEPHYAALLHQSMALTSLTEA